MIKIPVITICGLLSACAANAQIQRVGILASNQAVSLPVSGIPATTYSQFHPGLDLFAEKSFGSKEHHQWVLSANAGMNYHRFFQTALRLYGWGEYQYNLNERWDIRAGLGLGYLHAFPDYEQFVKNKDGGWDLVSPVAGRPQFLAGLGFGVSRALKQDKPDGMKLELRLRTFLQARFAGSYIPLLPSNALMLGISAPWPMKKGAKS
jgi:hypothetical protein